MGGFCQLPASTAPCQSPASTASCQLPASTASCQLPASTASCQLPASTASCQLPASTASCQLPASTASCQLPASTASCQLPASTASSFQPATISLHLFHAITVNFEELLQSLGEELGCVVMMKPRSVGLRGSLSSLSAFRARVVETFGELREEVTREEKRFLQEEDGETNRLGMLMAAWKGKVTASFLAVKAKLFVVFSGLRNQIASCRDDVMRFRLLLSDLRLSM